jgi:hypothetical protein
MNNLVKIGGIAALVYFLTRKKQQPATTTPANVAPTRPTVQTVQAAGAMPTYQTATVQTTRPTVKSADVQSASQPKPTDPFAVPADLSAVLRSEVLGI